MNPATLRNISRILHFIGAGFLGAYMYSPFTEYEFFVMFVKVIVFPSLALSGIWMWKGHKVRTLFYQRKS